MINNEQLNINLNNSNNKIYIDKNYYWRNDFLKNMVPDRLMPYCDQQTTNLLVSEFCEVLNNIDLKKSDSAVVSIKADENRSDHFIKGKKKVVRKHTETKKSIRRCKSKKEWGDKYFVADFMNHPDIQDKISPHETDGFVYFQINKTKKMEYGISENGFCLVCKKMMARTRAYQHSKTPRHQANITSYLSSNKFYDV